MSSDLDSNKIIKAADYTTKKNEKFNIITDTAKELLEKRMDSSLKKQSNKDLKELSELEKDFLEIKYMILEGKNDLAKMKKFELKIKDYKIILKDKTEDLSKDLLFNDANFSNSLELKNQGNKNMDLDQDYFSKYKKMRNSCIKFGFLSHEEKSFKYGEMLEILKSGKRQIKKRINDINEKNNKIEQTVLNDIGKKVLESSHIFSINILCKELGCSKSKLTSEVLSEEKEYYLKKLDYLVSKYKYNDELLKRVKKIRKDKLSLERSLHTPENKEKGKTEKFYDFVEKSVKKPGNYDYRKMSFRLMKEMDMSVPRIDKYCNTLQLIDNHLKNIKKSKSMDLH